MTSQKLPRGGALRDQAPAVAGPGQTNKRASAGGAAVRVHLIGTEDREAEIGTGEAAGQLLSRFADEANPVLSAIQIWLWPPIAASRLGAVAESVADVAALRAELAATREADRAGGEAGR
jgi:hypothetical protein